MKPDPVQWGGIALAAATGIQAGGWFLLLGPAALGLVLAHNHWLISHIDGEGVRP